MLISSESLWKFSFTFYNNFMLRGCQEIVSIPLGIPHSGEASVWKDNKPCTFLALVVLSDEILE
jgi:hypothetical protein